MYKKDGKIQLYGFETRLPNDETAAEVRDRLSRQAGVRFAAVYMGSFFVFAAAEASSLGTAQRAIGGTYAKAGFRTDWSTLLAPSRIRAPKRGSPRYSTIVRAQVDEDPEDVLERLDDRFEARSKADPRHARFFYGAGVVTGLGFDLLVEFGTSSEAGLWPLVRELRSVRGIGATDTSFADLVNNAKLAGGRPWKPTPPSTARKSTRRRAAKPRRRR